MVNMRKRCIRIAALSALGLLVWAGPALAQLETNLGGPAEANAEGYLKPLPTGLSATMNSSIFRTGRVPVEGFNLKFGLVAMSAKFDDADRTYTPTDPPGFASDGTAEVPTVIGDLASVGVAGTTPGTMLYYPGGFDIEFFEIAAPEVWIGSVMGTRAMVRFLSMDIGDADIGSFKLFGIGVQHSISQYFSNPAVDLAAGVFYQTFDIGDIVQSTALHFNVTGSKLVKSFLEPYVGVGYDSFTMDAEYTYDFEDTQETIKANFDTESNIHLTVGCNLLLSILNIYAEYNIAAANGAALGISFGN